MVSGRFAQNREGRVIIYKDRGHRKTRRKSYSLPHLQHSLHAAVSIGMDTETIISRLRLFCKTELPDSITKFIRDATAVYGKVKMVIVDDRFYLETPRRDIYDKLSKDPVITSAKTGLEGQGLLAQQKSEAIPEGMQVLGRGPAGRNRRTSASCETCNVNWRKSSLLRICASYGLTE